MRTGWQCANRVAAGWQWANRVAIYRVCEHSWNIECANRVAVCEQGGSVRTGWQCANRVAI